MTSSVSRNPLLDPRPAILFLCHPLTGHLTPTIKIAKSLVTSGHAVFFLGPTAHQQLITASGATFISLEGKADYNDLHYYSKDSPRPPVPDYHSRSWKDRAMVDVMKQWFDPIPEQWARVKYALAYVLAAKGPDAEVVIISEAIFHGLLPMFYGATSDDNVPVIKAVLCLSVTVPLIRSAHLPPFGSSLPYDEHLERRDEISRKWASWAQRSAPYKDLLEMKLAEAGATQGFNGIMFDGSMYSRFDAFLQLGSPSFFYPREWPANFRFIGAIPREPPLTNQTPLLFRDLPVVQALEAARNNERKKIVVVAQGTVETDPHQLVIPTCQAMAGRSDVFVLAIAPSWQTNEVIGSWGPGSPGRHGLLCVQRAGYDHVLRFADVWVHNGGYGAVQHGIANGVPMIIAGEGQDKTENGKRLAFSGAGIDLGTASPKVWALKGAIDTILGDRRYKQRVEVLRKESEELDCFATVGRIVAAFSTHRSTDVSMVSKMERTT